MRTRNIIGRIVLAAFLIYIIWMGWQIVRYKRYESAPAPIPAASAAPSLYEIEGVYHIHSRYSDGTKTVDQIAEKAARAGLDFILLTDHGKPNFAALDAQGWKRKVLVLAGAEISSSRGHLVALGFARPENSKQFSSNAETAAREIAASGGFSVVAHPYSKTRWSWGNIFEYSGLEIIDADSMLKNRILRSLPYYAGLLVKPTFALLKMIYPPEQTLRKWDQLLVRHPVSGYFSADAHFLYEAIFPVFHLHVLVEKPLGADFEEARRQVFDALRRGSFYSAVDAAAGARGFRFGREGAFLHVSTPFSFAHETIIIHDGRVIHRTRDNDVTLPLSGPGVYRAEVYLRERTPLDSGVPWILSNPVYYGRENR